jgi:hypothetical protein
MAMEGVSKLVRVKAADAKSQGDGGTQYRTVGVANGCYTQSNLEDAMFSAQIWKRNNAPT